MEKKFRNGDANNNPVVILILGAIFTAVSVFCLLKKDSILAQNNEEGNPKIFMLIIIIFGILGVYFLIYGIYRAIVLGQLKKLQKDENAHVTNATFVKAKLSSFTSTSTGINGIPTSLEANLYKKIIYKYNDENGIEREAKSLLSYFPNQIKYLENKQTFKIKCKGKLSIIIEEVPTEESLVKFNILKPDEAEINIK